MKSRQDFAGKAPIGHLDPSVAKDFLVDFQLWLDNHAGSDPKGIHLRKEALSKYTDSSPEGAKARKVAAIEKWLATERLNSKTNQRLLLDNPSFGFTGSRFEADELIASAYHLIVETIGLEPPEDILNGTFSNGASTAIKRQVGSVAKKFMDGADVTSDCWTHFVTEVIKFQSLRGIAPKLGFFHPKKVGGNVLFTVPKNSAIDRCAAKEPELNMYAQKGIGDFIRRALRKKGIDLNDQTRNQRLALVASQSQRLATVDLSSASDSISSVLVSRLLPPGWFVLLDACRSKTTDVEGTIHENAMFSSMGNGFTFELETLIFWALVRSVCRFTRTRGTISVYGDDIICPASIVPLLIKVFHFVGFRINEKKTFYKGPFRESCGKHYHDGIDVTPFYIKSPILNQERLIHALNRLRFWSLETREGRQFVRFDVYPLWRKYSTFIDARFHGGRDFDRIDALVSIAKPKCLLSRKVSKVSKGRSSELQLGAYLHWLRSAEGRSFRRTDFSLGLRIDELNLDLYDDVIVTTDFSVVHGDFVVRRNKLADNFGGRPLEFPEELFNVVHEAA